MAALSSLPTLLGCGAVGPIESQEWCPAGTLLRLACDAEQSPQALPPDCSGDCLPLDGPAAYAAVAASAGLTPDQLLSRYPVGFLDTLGYDPLSAANLKLIGNTELALSAQESNTLQKHGFLISAHSRFANFVYGYETLYFHHLPVFVSADSILHAVHRSYDTILASIEQAYLLDELTTLLTGLQAQLVGGAAAGFGATAIADADVYLTTARSLLADQLQTPAAGGSAAAVSELYNLARAAAGPSRVSLFGLPLDIDFTQFKPRGHYTDTPQLTQYFRCMMWLGRIPLQLASYDESQGPAPSLNRRAFEAAFLLTQSQDATARQHYQNIDAVLRLFVGEPDNMTPDQLAALLTAMGVVTPADLAAVSDGAILAALQSGGFGVQGIASQLLERGPQLGTLQVPGFFLFGQRFVPDSQVLSNVIYARAGGGNVLRFLPDPLDVAFAALRNNQAARLLQPELLRYAYAPDLAAARALVDGYGADYWRSNLYTGWLGALRALSPHAEITRTPATFGLPDVTGTEAWGRRLLNTQLASWAELRHDTILYAKATYATPLCEFPDAYVDPYPRFYAAVADLADRGASGLRALPSGAPVLSQAAQYFDGLGQVAGMLEEMAEFQRAHRAFTAAHMAFVNELVQVHQGCTGFETPGWFLKLYWDQHNANRDPFPVADVATDPNTGRVLHVGTGWPQLMVVTAQTCKGVRAYFGLASSYYEVTTGNFTRLDDMAWGDLLREQPPVDVPWVADLH